MDQDKKDTSLVHSFQSSSSFSFFSGKALIIMLIIAVIGVWSGYAISKKGERPGYVNTTAVGGSSQNGKGTVVGSTDTKTFKDIVEGVLEKGGVEGEGQYHLVRPGGESQNVYLTSSAVDLSLFLKKKVKVWGQTQKAQTAGWLMDVGKLEVLE